MKNFIRLTSAAAILAVSTFTFAYQPQASGTLQAAPPGNNLTLTFPAGGGTLEQHKGRWINYVTNGNIKGIPVKFVSFQCKGKHAAVVHILMKKGIAQQPPSTANVQTFRVLLKGVTCGI